MPKVSVIIPTYNCAGFIKEALDSAINQSFSDLEILVVDDGSTDNTAEVLQSYISKKIIKYFYQDKKGVSAARNLGIRESQGELIALLDADDIWLPDKLSLQIELIEKNPDICMVFTDAELFDKKGIIANSLLCVKTNQPRDGFIYKISQRRPNDGFILKDDFYNDLLLGNIIVTQSVLIPKRYIQETGYFDGTLAIAEDYDLWIRLARIGQFLYLNKVTVRCRIRNDGLSGGLDVRMTHWADWDGRVFEKHYRDCDKEYRKLIKERVIERYKIASKGYFDMCQLKDARRTSLKCLAYNKFQIKPYYYILASLFPVKVINYFRKK